MAFFLLIMTPSLSGCVKTKTNIEAESSCKFTSNAEYHCIVTVNSIQGGPQFIELPAPGNDNEVYVHVKFTVEEGIATVWPGNSNKEIIKSTAKPQQLAGFYQSAEI